MVGALYKSCIHNHFQQTNKYFSYESDKNPMQGINNDIILFDRQTLIRRKETISFELQGQLILPMINSSKH